jgi:epoxyqueuosine reductase
LLKATLPHLVRERHIDIQHVGRVPMTVAPDNKRLIRARALAIGFDAVGFCRAELGPEARERLAAFLAAGQHGDMGWLVSRATARGDPRTLWPDARSVVALGISYAPDADPLDPLRLPDRGSISVYARNRDYTTWSRAC